MIPALLYLLFKRYLASHPIIYKMQTIYLKWIVRIVALVVLTAILTSVVLAQSKNLQYTIKQRGETIGSLQFTQSASPQKSVLRLESDVQPKIIFAPSINASEESTFENEIMTSSSVYRRFNKKEKLNKRTTLQGDSYLIRKGSNVEVLKCIPIRQNMLCMYAREPQNVSKVYSDIFQEFLDIQRIGSQHYRIRFPDGNFNDYYYQNGICIKITVHHTLYNASIELKT